MHDEWRRFLHDIRNEPVLLPIAELVEKTPCAERRVANRAAIFRLDPARQRALWAIQPFADPGRCRPEDHKRHCDPEGMWMKNENERPDRDREQQTIFQVDIHETAALARQF
jgi:hypothetical protein